MTLMLAVATLCTGLAAGLACFAAWEPLLRLIREDAERYRRWSIDLFLGWSQQDCRRVAVAAKAAPAAAVIGLAAAGKVLMAPLIGYALYRAPEMLYALARERRSQLIEERLPDVVDVMVSSVRSGSSLLRAITDAAERAGGPIGQELALVAQEHEQSGLGLPESLERARGRVGNESFGMVATALAISADQGGRLLEVLERMAESIRSLSRLRQKIVSETTEVRAQQNIILWITPLFGVLVCLMDPGVWDLLSSTIGGQALLGLVILLQATAFFWIRSIVKSTI
ncbi:MAG: hypothetical protein GC160_04380 [Acidobacteria bacterium]|nr:hypothetical protein [Acidobacteriota bacterium]